MISEVIYSYSREQALSDGVLVDVSEMAKEAGIKFPVALTETLWNQFIVPSSNLISQGQSTEGRLWDLLFLFAYYARRASTSLINYKCLFLMESQDTPKPIKVKAHIGPGDTQEPVITIMLPEED